MKKIMVIGALALMSVLVLGGCKKKTPPPSEVHVYGWHMTAWQADGNTGDFPKGVYIEFKGDGSFDLYQDLNTNGFEKLTGSYTLDSSFKLTGTYADGSAWAYNYTVAGLSNPNLTVAAGVAGTMTMTALEDAAYKTTWTAGEIPASVLVQVQ